MKKVVVTGGTGFIGNCLINELVENNVFVYAIVRKDSPNKEKLNAIKNIKIVEMDIKEIDLLPLYVNKADAFYHLAWEGDRKDIDSQIKNMSNSVKAMRIANKLGIGHFIMTGSQAEYGSTRSLINEECPTNPTTPYGVCKLVTFNALDTLSRYLNMDLTWVRIFSVYGPGDSSDTLISYLMKCFSEKMVPKLTKGNQIWDFLYVEDAARALYLLGEKKVFGVFNLASGQNRQLKDFITEARDILSPGLELDFNPGEEKNKINLKADVRKIKNILNWQAVFSFEEGIKKTYFLEKSGKIL